MKEPGTSPALLAAAVLAACVATRVMTTHDFFPAWSGDPLSVGSPVVGLTPVWSLTLDAVTAVASLLVLLALRGRGLSPRWWESSLAGLGIVWVALHGWVLQGGSLQDILLGSTWCAAIAAALAARAAAREPGLRALLAASLLCLIGPLFLRGLAQVYVEHPQMLEAYRADRIAILASHGWSEDSPMTRAYERRLLQPEAIGWFGLANVYASVAAASLTGLLALAVAAARSATPRRGLLALAPGLGALLAAGALAYAKSKGGAGAFALGFLFVVFAQVGPRVFGLARARWAGVAGWLAPALVLGLVVARGLIGPRLGELSLLFRWFYLQGASEVFLHAPLWGTGPTGFKDAYSLWKPEIAPEDVSSPHSVLFDYAATLGIGGLAWCAVWLVWVRDAGRRLFEDPAVHELPGPAGTPPWPSLREHVQALLLALVAATLAGTFLERSLATPEYSIVRVGGLVIAGVVGAGVLRVIRGTSSGLAWMGIAAAALAAAAHAQIELTAVTPGSAAWLLVLLALAGPGNTAGAAMPRRPSLVPVVAVVTLGLALALPVAGLWRAVPWERALLRAYGEAEPAAMMDSRLRQLATSPDPSDPPKRVLTDLADLLHEPELLTKPLTDRDVTSAMMRLRARSSAAAAAELRTAVDLEPTDFQTLQAFSRLEVLRCSDLRQIGAPAAEIEMAIERALASLALYRGAESTVSWGWRASIWDAAWQIRGRRADLESAVDAWAKAAAYSPHGVQLPLSLARAALRLGDTKAAARWAQVALNNHDKMALDPLQGLTESQLVEMRGLAKQ